MAKIDKLLKNIDMNNVSDIHITSQLKPMIRINGELTNTYADIISDEEILQYINEVIPNRFDEFKKNGDIDFKYSNELGNFRVNAFKSKGCYSICMRVIRNDIPTIESISKSKVLRDFTTFSDGLVLITGSTGSGKSTTLAAMINEINSTQKKHIITLEEPIEYIYRNDKSIINQREIGEDTRSYTVGLKSALREDPDVILIGEMRDKETIEIALRAAQTGHLVFSTLHNMGAANSIYRIVNSFDMGYQNEIRIQLASILKGVIWQILVPKMEEKRRTAAMEIMVCTPGIKNLIREGNYEQINSFIQMGSKFGMQTMESDLKKLKENNIISNEIYEQTIKKIFY